MIHVSRADYLRLGHSAIPEDRFGELASRAGLYASARTLGRVGWSASPVRGKRTGLEERNMRGARALADLFHRDEAAVGLTGAAIISFANEGYRETYEGGAKAGSAGTLARRLDRILRAFFSPEQLSRLAE